jgi:hypothetical protein
MIGLLAGDDIARNGDNNICGIVGLTVGDFWYENVGDAAGGSDGCFWYVVAATMVGLASRSVAGLGEEILSLVYASCGDFGWSTLVLVGDTATD